jgi:hypothetical protein
MSLYLIHKYHFQGKEKHMVKKSQNIFPLSHSFQVIFVQGAQCSRSLILN